MRCAEGSTCILLLAEVMWTDARHVSEMPRTCFFNGPPKDLRHTLEPTLERTWGGA